MSDHHMAESRFALNAALASEPTNLLALRYDPHPARCCFDAPSLLAELRERVASGLVSERAHRELPELSIFTYTDRCTYDRAWDLVTLVARGLVMDTATPAVVATPFPKFFNYGEMGLVPSESAAFDVTNKLDGSLAIVFWYSGKWRVATKGSFHSEQAAWAQRWLDTMGPGRIPGCVGDTLLAEILYPENRIVVNYGERTGLFWLAGYDEDGTEMDIESGSPASCGVRNEFESVAQVAEHAQTLGADEEGFVLRFRENGLRLKIKGDEYCRIHRAVSHCTPLAVWELLMLDGSTEKLRAVLPEEFARDLAVIEGLLMESFVGVLDATAAASRDTKHLTDKELGQMIGSADRTLPEMTRFVFAVRKHDWFAKVQEPGSKFRRAAFETFRPTGNRLDGYTPGSAMNRFSEAA